MQEELEVIPQERPCRPTKRALVSMILSMWALIEGMYHQRGEIMSPGGQMYFQLPKKEMQDWVLR